MVSIYSLISKSSSSFFNPFRIVPSALTTAGINVIFMSHIYFSSLARSRYLSRVSLSLIFTQWSACTAGSLFLLIISRSARLAEIRGSFCTSKSHRGLGIAFPGTDVRLCRYHLFVWTNLHFLNIIK